jgi:hypothetical protein
MASRRELSEFERGMIMGARRVTHFRFPIEHLWDVVERSIHTQNPAPTNNRELWAAIQTAWLNISPEVFRPLVESMPCRVAAFRRTRGGPTRYYVPIPWLLKLQCICIYIYIYCYIFDVCLCWTYYDLMTSSISYGYVPMTDQWMQVNWLIDSLIYCVVNFILWICLKMLRPFLPLCPSATKHVKWWFKEDWTWNIFQIYPNALIFL